MATDRVVTQEDGIGQQEVDNEGRTWKNTWWRHQMETFLTLLALCAGNSPVTGEIPARRPVTRSFDVFFDLSLNKRLSKQSWGWWFETPSRLLWRHRYASVHTLEIFDKMCARYFCVLYCCIYDHNSWWIHVIYLSILAKLNTTEREPCAQFLRYNEHRRTQ